jgi:uncharacterized membrane protein YeiB
MKKLGIGRLENQSLMFSLLTSLTFFVVSVLFAHLWRKSFKRGPLGEEIMYTLADANKIGEKN